MTACRALAVALLTALPAMAQPVPDGAAEATPFERADVRAVCERIVCYCGCPHLQVSKCFCGTADRIREDVATQLDDGLTAEQVIEAYVAEHGTWALAVPPREGFHWSIWMAPVVVLVLGGLLVAWMGRRWVRGTPASQGARPVEVLSPEDLDRHRAELARALRGGD